MKIYINQQLEGKTKPQNKKQQQQQQKKERKKMPKTLAVMFRFGRA